MRGWSSICEGDPTHANGPPRVARLDERTQLRSQECIGVLGQCQSCEDGVSHQSGHSTVRGRVTGRAHDGMTRSALMASLIEESDAKRRVVQGAVHGGEPSVRTCYGLRGVRVGEASNPRIFAKPTARA